jgi:hypothetical protein
VRPMLTVDRVLHAVRRYDTLVVGLGVAGLDLTLQHHSDGIFCQKSSSVYRSTLETGSDLPTT